MHAILSCKLFIRLFRKQENRDVSRKPRDAAAVYYKEYFVDLTVKMSEVYGLLNIHTMREMLYRIRKMIQCIVLL